MPNEVIFYIIIAVLSGLSLILLFLRTGVEKQLMVKINELRDKCDRLTTENFLLFDEIAASRRDLQKTKRELFKLQHQLDTDENQRRAAEKDSGFLILANQLTTDDILEKIT